ncbi:MAG: hypothetical protein RQ826_11395 [Xanthomonadales bacterium]|nr:hypothetical protein [Xanthomonadales bacterium]
MKNISKLVVLLFLPACCGSVTAAEQTVPSNDSITIYSRVQPGAVAPELYRPTAGSQRPGTVPGYAIVRHDRRYNISKGISMLRVTDVAALIDPTTVTFKSLDTPKTRVLEQRFQFDLVSQEKLLQRYLGRNIVVEQARGEYLDRVEGLLLGTGGGLILQMEDGSVQAIRDYGSLHFPQLPGGLITKPTLEWLLDSPAAGAQNARLAYETGGMTWWADYNVVYAETGGCTMDISAWVSIINQSGAGYENARLKLIAGDINRVEQARPQREAVYAMAMQDEARGFTEKGFFEYHLYTLDRRTDLSDNATLQLQLFPAARGTTCKKELVFAPTLTMAYRGHRQLDQEYGRQDTGDISVFLRFQNEEAQQLGMPLPAGRIRVNQLDPADGSLEFIGEDVIDHTPRNEGVLIRLGNAFDLVGERVQTDYRVDTRSRDLWESFEIRLRNHKDEAADVVVLENLYRAANWEIGNANRAFEKVDSQQIRFQVNIASEEEAIIRYTAHYSW